MNRHSWGQVGREKKRTVCDLCERTVALKDACLIHDSHLPCDKRTPEAIKQLRYEEAISAGHSDDEARGFANTAVVCKRCVERLRESECVGSAIH